MSRPLILAFVPTLRDLCMVVRTVVGMLRIRVLNPTESLCEPSRTKSRQFRIVE